MSLDLMADPDLKRDAGKIACQETGSRVPGVGDGVLGDPRDMAKAGLPEP